MTVSTDAEKLITELITGHDHHVMDTAGIIFGNCQHVAPEAGLRGIAFARLHAKE